MESGQDCRACAERWLCHQRRAAQGRAGFQSAVVARHGLIDTSDTLIGVEIDQIYARYLKAGQPVEVTFKFRPGQVYTGKVETVLQAISAGQVQVSGTAVTPKGIQAGPLVVRIRLNDAAVAEDLPAGSAGAAAIFTDHIKSAHIICKVLLRQIAITNYINPF